MKFKVDENLPVEVADLLGLAGHDATTVLAQNLGGSPDQDLVSICQDEDRALITLDTDFTDIRTYPPKQYPGLVVLRLRRQGKVSVMSTLERLIPLLSSETLAQHLWIVEESRVRIRG